MFPNSPNKKGHPNPLTNVWVLNSFFLKLSYETKAHEATGQEKEYRCPEYTSLFGTENYKGEFNIGVKSNW